MLRVGTNICKEFWKDTFWDAFSGTPFYGFDLFDLSFHKTFSFAKD